MGFDESAQKYLVSSDHREGDDLEFFRRRFERIVFDRLLDVATGAGHFLSAFNVREKIACDPSINMLKVARSYYKPDGVVSCVAETLPFSSSVFDMVTCRIALHHFRSPAAFFSEAFRVLRDGGLLVLVDSIVDVDDEYLNAIERLRDETHVRSYRVEEIVGFGSSSGFRLLEFKFIFKRHDFEEWAYRVSFSEGKFEELKKAFLSLPQRVKDELRVEVKDGEVVSYVDKKGMFIFEKI